MLSKIAFVCATSVFAISLFGLPQTKAEPKSKAPTYAKDVAAIVNRSCVQCHRPGEIGPFSLIGYANVKKWAPNIARVTGQATMPPWKAVHGYGDFKDENLLSKEEIETLKAWSDAGAPRGNAADEPKPPTFKSGWLLGEPDQILAPKTEVSVEADGRDDYRNFVIPTDYKETKYISAMDCKPGNNAVVHHIVVYIDEKGASKKLESDNDGQEGYLTNGGISPGFRPDNVPYVWAPGLRPHHMPDGVAFELKPGATLVLQVHYHKNGIAQKDKSSVGLYFTDKPVKKNAQIEAFLDARLMIPAGAKEHKWERTYNIPYDGTMYSIMPHMHLLGKSMKADLIAPDGTETPLVYVKQWDFNWQLNYAFKEPLKIKKGSKIRISAVYDNSADNPLNPHNPPADVHFGEQTTDEMFVLVFTMTAD